MPIEGTATRTTISETMSLLEAAEQRLPEEGSPRRAFPYRLLHRVGEGGMGEVWVAEQLEPVRRKVAFKVIKAGMDTRQVVARFEAERQALALMDHPAIAKVFDGGATPQGRPYFVMEYVPGVSITQHCDEHRLRTRERLELFIQVCEGVQHAHQKAVIHRDLKPSNILVALSDGRPQPKIIDFGIAKATGQRLTDKTLYTEAGTIIGTPEYMSPEQADVAGQDVDTRTDVYSLGVVLYELLTGRLPFSSAELRSSSYEELRRKIKEVDPPPPSARLATLDHQANDDARSRSRQTDVRRLRWEIHGDLDAITMKALEKERSRRYGTPSELATDVGRFLRNEPVVARRPSRAYRMERYARRHRLAVAISSGLVILLVAFAATMTVQARRIARERDRANEERNRANAERDRANEESNWARAWVEHAKDLAGENLQINNSHLNDSFTRKMGPDIINTLDALLYKTRRLREQGRLLDSERLARDTLVLAWKQNDPDNLFTIWARNELGATLLLQGRFAEAETVLRESAAIGRRTLGPKLPLVGWAFFDLAIALVRQEKKEGAISVLEDGFREGLEPLHGSLIANEVNFRSLHGDPRFESLVITAKARVSTTPR